MIIKGTDTIRGILDLYSIKQQLKKGQSLSIKDAEFHNSDIQIALSMGWLEARNTSTSQGGEKGDDEKQVQCLNAYHQPIGLSQFPTDISPGQRFYLSRADLDLPNIKAAVKQGMITVLEEGEEVELSEATVHVNKYLGLPDEVASDDKLDTNEEIMVPTQQSKPKKIKDKKKDVVWNRVPTKEGVKTVEPATDVITSSNPVAVDSNKGDPRKNTIVMEAGRAKKTTMKKDITMVEEQFVDAEETAERVKSHPILSKQSLPQNQEVELITKDEAAEQRIKTHKVLGKKAAKKEEVDFVEMDDSEERRKKHPVLGKDE